jgi:hypothetical protein
LYLYFSVGVAGQFLFQDQEIIVDVPLISGHRIHVDLVPRQQHVLPTQPSANHNDSGRDSHSSDPDNDEGVGSSILSQNEEQNNQENVVLSTLSNDRSEDSTNVTDANSNVRSSPEESTSDRFSDSSLSEESTSDRSSDSSLLENSASVIDSCSDRFLSDDLANVDTDSSNRLLLEDSVNVVQSDDLVNVENGLSNTLSVLVEVLNVLHEEDIIDFDKDENIESFLCTVVHLAQRN